MAGDVTLTQQNNKNKMIKPTIADIKPLALAGRVPFIPVMLDNLAFNLAIDDFSDRGKVKDITSALDYVLKGRGYTFDSLNASDKATANCALSCARTGDYAAALDDLRTLDYCLLADNRKRAAG